MMVWSRMQLLWAQAYFTLRTGSNLAPYAKPARANGQGKCRIASCLFGSGLEPGNHYCKSPLSRQAHSCSFPGPKVN
jgi:hypothetical protein